MAPFAGGGTKRKRPDRTAGRVESYLLSPQQAAFRLDYLRQAPEESAVLLGLAREHLPDLPSCLSYLLAVHDVISYDMLNVVWYSNVYFLLLSPKKPMMF